MRTSLLRRRDGDAASAKAEECLALGFQHLKRCRRIFRSFGGSASLLSLSAFLPPPPQAKPHTHEDRAGDRDPVGQTQVVLPVPTPQAVLKGLLVQKLLSFGNLMRLIQYLLLVL